MSKIRFALQSFALLVFTLAVTSAVQAQATRTWVSGVGDDVNPCSRTAPCKTFAGAISKTAAGGEIDALDPGGYGTVTITKSITIEGSGTHASILASGTNGVIVNDSATATPGTINVILRNLSINGAGTTLGLNGIRFLSGRSLKVEKTRIMHFSNHGIDVSLPVGSTSELLVHETVITNTAGSAISTTSQGVFNGTIDTSVLSDGGNGLTVAVGTVNISNSVVASNTTNGIQTTTNQAVINATRNRVLQNGSSGISASSGSTIRISDNDVFRNGTGLTNNGTMETYRNNKVRGNTANVGGAVALTDISGVGVGVQ